ncbi:hypothetical protein KKF84_08560 [Myxococcota bacterium]|nr:hypothetical protein [Myxococcota bacterium]
MPNSVQRSEQPPARRILSPKYVMVVIIGLTLTASLASNAILGWNLYRAKTVEKVNAWKSCHKLSMQHILYEKARARALSEGRTLVVIGNPTGGFVNKHVQVYGCGDVCIDIAGCRPCGMEARVLKADALEALKTIPDNSAVVFESEVFEYVDSMDMVVRELDRITGGDHTRIFAVHTISIDSWNYHTLGVVMNPPDPAQIEKRRQNRKKYARTGEGLARRIIYQFPPRHHYAWTEI